jgi:hypothetical protein
VFGVGCTDGVEDERAREGQRVGRGRRDQVHMFAVEPHDDGVSCLPDGLDQRLGLDRQAVRRRRSQNSFVVGVAGIDGVTPEAKHLQGVRAEGDLTFVGQRRRGRDLVEEAQWCDDAGLWACVLAHRYGRDSEAVAVAADETEGVPVEVEQHAGQGGPVFISADGVSHGPERCNEVRGGDRAAAGPGEDFCGGVEVRTGRALRQPRARTRNKAQGHVTADVVLSERPAEAADRAVPGHWEGDLIIGTGRSAIGTLVERSSRSTLLVHLPRLEGWGAKPPVKNGPSLGGYGAVAMNAALTASMTTLPQQLRKTLTWDRGKELSGHAQFALATGTKVFFADPHSPWQRPTNENSNGLLRQYFPKDTDLSRWSAEDLQAVALAINDRPRKVLGWKTPAEVLAEQLRSLQQPGVASTG